MVSSSVLMTQRKEKRMLSNRESARRSRMRKQKHLEDLMAKVNCLLQEKNQLFTALNVTTQHYIGVEAENSVLRTQMTELSNRLLCLNEIMHCMNAAASFATAGEFATGLPAGEDDDLLRPWSPLLIKHFLMDMGSEMFQYCNYC